MSNDILIYSFHTKDEYYSGKAAELARNCEDLGVEYVIEPIEIPDGLEWPDICRKKIEKLYLFSRDNPDKRVFWIDVDCRLNFLPAYLSGFSADIIGFTRGFSSPMKLGYHRRTRFWEPCFLGINCTEGGRRFIEDAYIFEQKFEGSATDDYFFEESWRLNCSHLSFQVIPSTQVDRNGSEVGSLTKFFSFGASGNVEKFVGKVVQHGSVEPKMKNSVMTGDRFRRLVSAMVPRPAKSALRKAISLVKSNGKQVQHQAARLPLKIFKTSALTAGVQGDVDKLSQIEKSIVGTSSVDDSRRDIVRQCQSLAEYRNRFDRDGGREVLPLSWWINPPPGNFGDWLSPYIFQGVSERPVKFVNPMKNNTEAPHVLGIGSIGKFANESSIVIGSGISTAATQMNPLATYCSVRGPLTWQAIRESGGNCPEIFGDPGILMPELYKAKTVRTKTGKVGLVRHFKHRDVPLLLPGHVEEVDIFASSSVEIEAFVEKLHKFDYVICSAMHAYIVCNAYDIPCGLVSFSGLEGAVHGDGMKYRDYFLGIGQEARSPLVISRNLRGCDLENYVHSSAISQAVKDDLMAVMREQLVAHSLIGAEVA